MQSTLKEFSNQEEQNQYYHQLEKDAIKIMSYPVLLDQYEMIQKNEKFIIINNENDKRFFIKDKEESQHIDTLRISTGFMKKTNNMSFMYSVGVIKDRGLILYDYYEENYYSILTNFYNKYNHKMILETIIRILIEISHLDKINICHFDLHLRNILYSGTIRSEWTYTTDRGNWTFYDSPYELVIGDFGLSLLRTSKEYFMDVEYFYKNFFPIYYYAQRSSDIYKKINHTFIDIWRFLRTLLNVLSNYPYIELRKSIDFIKIYCSMAEKILCSKNIQSVSNFCYDLIELLSYEIERVG